MKKGIIIGCITVLLLGITTGIYFYRVNTQWMHNIAYKKTLENLRETPVLTIEPVSGIVRKQYIDTRYKGYTETGTVHVFSRYDKRRRTVPNILIEDNLDLDNPLLGKGRYFPMHEREIDTEDAQWIIDVVKGP